VLWLKVLWLKLVIAVVIDNIHGRATNETVFHLLPGEYILTYSIVARDAQSGEFGVAVASRFFAVGSLVPHVRHNMALATQAFVNPMWGVEGASRLSNGEDADAIMADFIKRDAGQAIRQAHMIGTSGNSVMHTGSACIDWAGHVSAHGISVAGNMLAGRNVVEEAAMEAGEAAGGDKRGRQSAALKIHHGQDYPVLDLRTDDHADPLAELRRLHSVAGERAIHFTKTFATADNFSGTTDRTELDQSIAKREAQWISDGIISRSHASVSS